MSTKKQALAVSLMAIVIATASASWAQDAAKASKDGVTFTPSIGVSETYDDNIYTERTNTNDDFITKVTPELVMDAQKEDTKVKLTAGLTRSFFADDPGNDRTDYTTSAKANAKLNDLLSWEGFTDFRRLHSDRGDADADPTTEATKAPVYNAIRANTSVVYKNYGATFKPRLGFTNFNYQDSNRINGGTIDQDFRDRAEYVAGGRIGYDVTKALEVYADGEANPHEYQVSSATERSSKAGTYLVGFVFKPSKTLKFDLGAGYMTRNFDKNVYRDIEAPDFTAGLQWSVTDTGVFRANIDRTIVDVTDTGVGAALRTIYKTSFTQSITDALSAKLEARFSQSIYKGGNGATNGTDRSDNLYGATFGLNYALNDALSFTGDYTYGNKDSNRDTSDYKSHIVVVGMKYGF